MLKINRAKRSDDAPRQWQRWTGTNREREWAERERNQKHFKLDFGVFAASQVIREERRATHKKRARASNSTPFQWWQAPSERCYLRCRCCCCRCRLINSSVCACVRASERVNTTVWWEVVVWCAERVGVGEMRAELDCQAKCCRTVAWLFCLPACLPACMGGREWDALFVCLHSHSRLTVS